MLWLTVVAFVSCVLAVYWSERASYNWDMLAYIAVALADAGTAPSHIHDMTYASLAAVPQGSREALLEGNVRRIRVAHDAERFLDQLPFYSVKPLYPWLISMLYRAGAQLPAATVMVSTASYALISILLFLWFSHLVPAAFAALLACGIAVTPLLTRVAVLSTPDALSALIVLTALYFSFMKNRHGTAVVILIISILARPENLIYAGGLCLYLAFTRKLSLLAVAASCLAVLALFLTMSRMIGAYEHKTLIYYTFVNSDIDVKRFVSPLGWREYAQIYLHGLHDLIFNPINYFAVLAPLALSTVVITTLRRDWSDKYFHMVLLAGICAAARYAILPAEFWRAFLVPYTMTLIAFVAVCYHLAADTIGDWSYTRARRKKSSF